MDIANVPYTFKCLGSGIESTLDHFLISPNLISSVSNYETIDMYNNFSDHSPIMLSLNIDIDSFTTENRVFQPSVDGTNAVMMI